MNWKLKEKITEKYGTQSDFAIVLKGHESDVSRVIRGRRSLTDEERQLWADLLEVDRAELFGEEADHVQN